MILLPAIDMKDGRCVRLQQGDFERQTVYSDDPLDMARAWAGQGAEWLHLVDLDGAKEGGLSINSPIVERIVAELGLPVQLGGGVRDEETIRHWLNLGVQRLVVGTKAVREPEWFDAMAQKFPGQLVLGLDAKGGRVATDGWLNVSELDAVSLASSFETLPLAGIVYTDIARDGMLVGPNFVMTERIAREVKLPVVASGGVSCLEDLRKLSNMPVWGAIVGKALYEKRFSLDEALACVQAG
ncbi:1-(5-phosphoribosyl)-5-[(5-phosphoribosylamino)methylideneamino]imidazole-4-carboxamide isomerase [bacterium]|nr:1-(5-phosphoribosyl)-5-[(5-phosphoribosylamino)methylideneamino]imidazole-4-carboxamide isomerase [bacterium]